MQSPIFPGTGRFSFKFIARATTNLPVILLIICPIAQSALAASLDHFVTTWDSQWPGTSNSTSITVPMVGGPYDADWNNDGIFDEFGLYDSVTHDFGVAGIHTIRIRGSYNAISFSDGGDKLKIFSVDQWGTNAWTTMANAFHGAANLEIPATDTPDFSAVTDMSFMFRSAREARPDTSGWDTSAVIDMSGMFFFARAANPDTSSWDTSAVTNMSDMFSNAYTANPDTSGWNTSAVSNMSRMFADAWSANPDTSGWDTSAVTNLEGMFFCSYTFCSNTAMPDTSSWDTSAVTDMSYMFYGAQSANPDTSDWDTSDVTDMSYMFYFANSFDRDIGSWNVTALMSADGMFHGVTLSPANYDSLLIGWNAQSLQPGVVFSAGHSSYCSTEATAARDNMIAADVWIITDFGRACVQPTDRELRNISTRADVGTVHDIAIAGFIITGVEQKCIIVRGRGPSVEVPTGVMRLPDPQLILKSGQTTIAANNNWREPFTDHVLLIENLGLAPGDPLDAAIYKCLEPGPYTVFLKGYLDSTGVGIVEVYDVDGGLAYLGNLSTRARVGTDHQVVIAGFVIKGDTPKQILVRGRGPDVGVPINVTRLADPILTLKSGSTTIGSNDNWQDAINVAEIIATGKAPDDPLDAAILMMLQPGVYTVILGGVDDVTGSGIVEILDLTGR